MEHFKNEGRSEFLEFLRGFELKRRTFNKDSMKRVVLKIPPALVDILSEKSGEEFEEKFKTLQQNKALSFSGDKLNTDNSLFASFFESSMNDIISHIEDIFNADICRDLVGVVMVGGFSESMFVNSAVFPFSRAKNLLFQWKLVWLLPRGQFFLDTILTSFFPEHVDIHTDAKVAFALIFLNIHKKRGKL